MINLAFRQTTFFPNEKKGAKLGERMVGWLEEVATKLADLMVKVCLVKINTVFCVWQTGKLTKCQKL